MVLAGDLVPAGTTLVTPDLLYIIGNNFIVPFSVCQVEGSMASTFIT